MNCMGFKSESKSASAVTSAKTSAKTSSITSAVKGARSVKGAKVPSDGSRRSIFVKLPKLALAGIVTVALVATASIAYAVVAPQSLCHSQQPTH